MKKAFEINSLRTRFLDFPTLLLAISKGYEPPGVGEREVGASKAKDEDEDEDEENEEEKQRSRL